jgi:hypothetical protein
VLVFSWLLINAGNRVTCIRRVVFLAVFYVKGYA